MSEPHTPPPLSPAAAAIEELKQAPRDKRVVAGLIAAVGAGVLFGLLLKPTLGDRPAAERYTGGKPIQIAAAGDGGLDIVVNTRLADEGKLPESTTLLPAPIQGVPPPAPLIRVSAPARAGADPFGRSDPIRRTSMPRDGGPDYRVCADARSDVEAMVCAEPRLSAADARLRRAYDRALEAGASPRRLDRQQGRWLAAREDAARDNPRAVAEVYEARIAELEDMAAYPD